MAVALRKESVDRNLYTLTRCASHRVALRKESVDRNADGVVSGSADYVALRKESVDRNFEGVSFLRKITSRSPQGERG